MTAASDRLLRRLEWRVVRRLDGRLQGAYRTVWHGAGIDFTDLRAYTPEDDVRHIDWNVTARLDEPFVRQYTEERDLTAWLVLDRSRSMSFADAAPGGQSKDGVLTELALCLARMLSHRGNRVGAILYDDPTHRVLPPRSGRNHVLRLGHELARSPESPGARCRWKLPRRAGSRPDRTTDLAAMLRVAAATLRRRCLIFVISDFIGDPGWERVLGQLGHRHEVVVIRVVDPVELEFPDLGPVVVSDAETGEQLLVDTSDPLLRRRLDAQVQAREAGLADAMRQTGVTAHRVRTDVDLTHALLGMVQYSGRSRR